MVLVSMMLMSVGSVAVPLVLPAPDRPLPKQILHPSSAGRDRPHDRSGRVLLFLKSGIDDRDICPPVGIADQTGTIDISKNQRSREVRGLDVGLPCFLIQPQPAFHLKSNAAAAETP